MKEEKAGFSSSVSGKYSTACEANTLIGATSSVNVVGGVGSVTRSGKGGSGTVKGGSGSSITDQAPVHRSKGGETEIQLSAIRHFRQVSPSSFFPSYCDARQSWRLSKRRWRQSINQSTKSNQEKEKLLCDKELCELAQVKAALEADELSINHCH